MEKCDFWKIKYKYVFIFVILIDREVLTQNFVFHVWLSLTNYMQKIFLKILSNTQKNLILSFCSNQAFIYLSYFFNIFHLK